MFGATEAYRLAAAEDEGWMFYKNVWRYCCFHVNSVNNSVVIRRRIKKLLHLVTLLTRSHDMFSHRDCVPYKGVSHITYHCGVQVRKLGCSCVAPVLRSKRGLRDRHETVLYCSWSLHAEYLPL